MGKTKLPERQTNVSTPTESCDEGLLHQAYQVVTNYPYYHKQSFLFYAMFIHLLFSTAWKNSSPSTLMMYNIEARRWTDVFFGKRSYIASALRTSKKVNHNCTCTFHLIIHDLSCQCIVRRLHHILHLLYQWLPVKYGKRQTRNPKQLWGSHCYPCRSLLILKYILLWLSYVR